jgi:excisionase family DNA binding protein
MNRADEGKMAYRTSKPPLSQAVSHITGNGPRGRALTRLRTIDEVAELFNASRRTVQRLIRSGALPAHRLGRAVRISDADIEAFLVANRSV